MRYFTLDQALARAEKRKKVASMRDDMLRAQTYGHLKNELSRVEGVLYHRLRPGHAAHSLHEHQAEKLRGALAEMFDIARP
jgi:hypothetical protein